MHMLANMSWGQWFTAMLIVVICAFLMLVIMLQRGRGGGLAGAFGGAGGSSAFGAKTGDVFTWITVVVAAAFVVVCVVGGFVFEPANAQQTALTTPGDGPDSVPETTLPPESGTTVPVTVPVTVPAGEAPSPTTTTPDTDGTADAVVPEEAEPTPGDAGTVAEPAGSPEGESDKADGTDEGQ